MFVSKKVQFPCILTELTQKPKSSPVDCGMMSLQLFKNTTRLLWASLSKASSPSFWSKRIIYLSRQETRRISRFVMCSISQYWAISMKSHLCVANRIGSNWNANDFNPAFDWNVKGLWKHDFDFNVVGRLADDRLAIAIRLVFHLDV